MQIVREKNPFVKFPFISNNELSFPEILKSLADKDQSVTEVDPFELLQDIVEEIVYQSKRLRLDDNTVSYICTGIINGHRFTASASKEEDAKREIAQEILAKLFNFYINLNLSEANSSFGTPKIPKIINRSPEQQLADHCER